MKIRSVVTEIAIYCLIFLVIWTLAWYIVSIIEAYVAGIRDKMTLFLVKGMVNGIRKAVFVDEESVYLAATKAEKLLTSSSKSGDKARADSVEAILDIDTVFYLEDYPSIYIPRNLKGVEERTYKVREG